MGIGCAKRATRTAQACSRELGQRDGGVPALGLGPVGGRGERPLGSEGFGCAVPRTLGLAKRSQGPTLPWRGLRGGSQAPGGPGLWEGRS